jgi:hypothetical protein
MPADDGTLVWVRVSKDYLDNHVERDVARTKPVRDYILGTTISGQSRTVGKTKLVLLESENRARGEVRFEGTCTGQEIGRNGPATLQIISNSTFHARKPVAIGEAGLIAEPATAHARTRLTTTSIQTSLPRLRGRIAQRIAWRRVAQSRAQADAIASDHTAANVRRSLDERLNDTIASIQSQIRSQIALAKLEDERGRAPMVQSRSTSDAIEIALCKPGSADSSWRQFASNVDGDSEVTVYVHRTVVARILGDDKLRARYATLLGTNLGDATLVAKRPNTAKSSNRLVASDWSMRGPWLSIDLTTADNRATKPPRGIALNEETSREVLVR